MGRALEAAKQRPGSATSAREEGDDTARLLAVLGELLPVLALDRGRSTAERYSGSII